MNNKKKPIALLLTVGLGISGAVSSCNDQNDIIQPNNKVIEQPITSQNITEPIDITVKRYRQSALIFAELNSRFPRIIEQIYDITKERNRENFDEVVLFSELSMYTINDSEEIFSDDTFEEAFNKLATSHDYHGSQDYLDPIFDNTFSINAANGVAIYLPYSNDHSSYYDAGVVNRQSKQRPYIGYASPDNEISGRTESFSWGDATVDERHYQVSTFNESDAAGYPTWIIQPADKDDITSINRYNNGYRAASPQAITTVQVGWVKLTQQLDSWISFTGNGGGSELRFIRPEVSAKTDPATGVVSAGTNGYPTISVNISRSDIKRGNYVRVYSYWDFDWAESKKTQHFAVYEDDVNGTKTINMTAKLIVPLGTPGSTPTANGSGEISFSNNYTVTTKDDIIYQNEISRQSYLQINSQDTGNGKRDGFNIYSGGNFLYFTLPNTQ